MEKHDGKSTFVIVETVYLMMESFATCFTHVSLTLSDNFYGLFPKNLVGRFLMHIWVLGRYTRFNDPVPWLS